MEPNRDMSTVVWGIAGLPLVVTFVQTVLALLDWTSETIGVTGLLSPLFEVDVIFAAAVVFKQQPALVTILFLFIAIAWVIQGVSMHVINHRDAAFAAAGFAALLYLILFLGVYSGLFSRGIAAGQLLAFFSIPLVASGLVVGAALTHDWSEDVIRQASGQLGNLESRVETARAEFDTAFTEQIGDLDTLEAVAPSGVAEARSDREAFHDRCDELIAEIRDLQERSEDATRLQSEVSRIESSVADLDPDAAVGRIATDLRQRVRSGVRTTFKGIGASSRFEGTYTLSNLGTEYREVRLEPSGGAVHIDDIADVLVRLLEDGDRLAAVGDAVTTAVEHRNRVTEFLEDREQKVADRIEAIETTITTVEEQIDRFSDPISQRIRQVLIENRNKAIEGTTVIERGIRDAKAALHECRLDDCDRLLEDAESRSETLLTVAEFLRSLDGRLGHGGSSVDIPREVDTDVVAAVAPAFAEQYDGDVTVVDDRVEIGSDNSQSARQSQDAESSIGSLSSGSETENDEVDPTEADDVSQRPEEVLDSALYFLRELEEQARNAGDNRIQYQTDNLPPGIATPSTLSNVERFLSHQSDLFGEVTLQSTEPPAFIEIVVADELRPGAALQTARDRFIERYD